jgi:hypothetical protein
MTKIVNSKIFLILINFLILNYIFFSQRIIFRQNPYIAGDWLINYQGGFVRRGFLGELFYQISKIFDISILNILFLFNSIIIVFFFFLTYSIIKNSLKNYIFTIYCLLPSTFLFTFFDPLAVARKDYLILLPYLIYAYMAEKKINNIFINFTLCVFFLILALTHELVIFFIPYLFFIKILVNSNSLLSIKNFKFEIAYLLLCFLVLIAIYAFSNPFNSQICDSLLSLGLSKEICQGVIRDFGTETYGLMPFQYMISYFNQFKYHNYLFYFILNFFPILFILYKNKKKPECKTYLIFTFVIFIISTPIFINGTDWGRYLNIHFILHSICFHFLIQKLNNNENNINNLKKIIFIPIILIYLSSWHMPHCCQKKIGNGYYYIFERITYRINDESNETHKYGEDLPRIILKKIINFF